MSVVPDSFAAVYSDALLGDDCAVLDMAGSPRPLPVRRWARTATPGDRLLIAQCHGATVDIGCGPGRMTQALAEAGMPALGIDLVPEAVRQARARGVAALVRDVFEPLPAEGRWGSALLADGNIGIGGDPRALLRRVAELVEPGGRVVLDLAEPGTGVHTRSLRLATPARRSRPFRWTSVGPDGIAAVVAGTGLLVDVLHHRADRWFAVLRRSS